MKIKRFLIIFSAVLLAGAASVKAFEKEAYLAYLRGLIDEQSEDISGAIGEFNKTVSLDKNATPVYRDLAYAYWQEGEKTSAFESAKKLKELEGENLDAQLFLGSFYMTAGDTASARQAWEDALKIDPHNETAILYLAAFYSTNNRPKEAVEYWNRYILLKPESAESYYQRGLSYQKLGELQKAEKSLEQTIAIKPESYEAYFALAQLYEQEGRYTDAVRECEQYLTFSPDNATILLYLGGLYYKVKDYDSAEEVFKKAEKINPSDTTIIFWLGTVAEEKKDWKEAIKYFEILKEKEETPMLLARLSYYYSFAGKNSKASECLEKAVKLDPKNPNLYYLAALSFSDLKKYSVAKKNFDEAIKLKPDFADAYFHMGIMYDDWGKFPEAEESLEKAIEIDPKNSAALNYLGYSYAERGIKLEKAEALLQKALSLDPGNPAFLDSMGWVYYKEDKVPEAEKLVSAATEKLEDPVLYKHLGEIKLKLSKRGEGWQALRNALELSPEDKKIKARLNEIESGISENELAKAMIERVINKYVRLKSLSFKFFLKGETNSYNFSFTGSAKFLKPDLWRVDVFGGIMNPEFSAVLNKDIRLNPQAFEKYIPEVVSDFFKAGGFSLTEFGSDETKISRKGNHFIYEHKDKTLSIYKETALPEKLLILNGLSIKFSDYSLVRTCNLPAAIDFISKNKLKGTIKITDYEIDKIKDSSIFKFEKDTSK